MNLKRKVGPLPLWAWIAIAGGSIGAIVLIKKGKKPATESEPIPSSLASPFGPGVGAEGGGAGGGVGAGEGVKTPEPTLQPIVTEGPQRAPVSEFLATEHELEEGGWHRGQAPTGSQAPATSQALHAANGGHPNPRAGIKFKTTTYRGHRAHEYPHKVPGGVGPGGRFIVVGVGKKTHSAKPKHEPAHAKDKQRVPAHHPPPPTHHNGKKPAAHHPPAKRKPAAKRKARR
jgi:hypothetical protein